MSIFDRVKLQDNGLIPAIIIDHATSTVLTLCYMNRDALEKTVETGEVYVYRRSRKQLMKKGETSGHTQAVREIFVDCDGNSLLIRVDQKVAACHAGYFTCYYRKYNPQTAQMETVGEKVFDPKKVY